MAVAESLLPEFDHEIATTRRLLEVVPDAKGSWKPHWKSMGLGELAVHIATIPGWGVATLEQTEFDVNPPGGSGYTPPEYQSTATTLAILDEGARATRAALAATSDAELMTLWTLKNGGQKIMAMPRIAVVRSCILNHMIHHRGQLSVYLRLNDVPLPSMYGPTADTPMEPRGMS